MAETPNKKTARIAKKTSTSTNEDDAMGPSTSAFLDFRRGGMTLYNDYNFPIWVNPDPDYTKPDWLDCSAERDEAAGRTRMILPGKYFLYRWHYLGLVDVCDMQALHMRGADPDRTDGLGSQIPFTVRGVSAMYLRCLWQVFFGKLERCIHDRRVKKRMKKTMKAKKAQEKEKIEAEKKEAAKKIQQESAAKKADMEKRVESEKSQMVERRWSVGDFTQ